jgi:serine/threonine-protein kinase
MRALAKDPAHRFATAEDFLHALRLNPSAREQAVAVTLPLPKPIALASQPSTGSPQQKMPSASNMQSLPLEEVSKKLAVYVGPVAKFIVKKLAAQSDDVDFIYREAAKQIGSDTDRAAFLRSKSH